jgi:hypothetical protein
MTCRNEYNGIRHRVMEKGKGRSRRKEERKDEYEIKIDVLK